MTVLKKFCTFKTKSLSDKSDDLNPCHLNSLFEYSLSTCLDNVLKKPVHYAQKDKIDKESFYDRVPPCDKLHAIQEQTLSFRYRDFSKRKIKLNII